MRCIMRWSMKPALYQDIFPMLIVFTQMQASNFQSDPSSNSQSAGHTILLYLIKYSNTMELRWPQFWEFWEFYHQESCKNQQ